jgi:membrane fusion protein, multidrug efflux system
MIIMINTLNMKKILNITGIIIIATFFLVSCGGSGVKDAKGDINSIKTEIEKLKKEKGSLDAEIKKLEDKLAKADPSAAKQTAKLVGIDTLRVQDFSHYIELQGKIDADGIAYVAPTGQGGQVKSVFVKLGQRVGKGQLILKLDDAMARQGVVGAQQMVIGAQQQTGQVKARLEQAQTIYTKYQNLWKQGIGAEIQVINAKADVDALAAQLRAAQAQVGTAQAQVRMAQEQTNMSNVYAQMSGVIDEMNVEPGEFFSPQTAAQPGMGIRIVNNASLKVVTEVPDNYVARVKKGDKVMIEVPETGLAAIESTITTVGASINPTTRSFTTEAKLKTDPLLKPNQTATLKILDYEAKATVAVPVNVVQADEKSKYLYIMEKAGDKWVARKKVIITGEAYNGLMEVKSGLTGGELIITEGYQTVYDGQTVTTGK